MRSLLLMGFCLLVFSLGALPAHAAEERQGSELVGVGLQVVPTVKGDLVVLAVVDGSSAQEAGVQPGDLIIAVDGFPLHGSEFSEVVTQYLWGPQGSVVHLALLRPGREGLVHIQVMRKALKDVQKDRIPGVRMLDPSEN